jgi:hypothetical protein
MAPATEESKKAKCSTAAFLREVGMQISLVTVSHPSPRTVAPPPYLPLDIKDSLKKEGGF